MSKSTDNWMDEEGGIPHKNGSVRFYLVGFEEGVYGYLGWFDMTDWDEGWKKVWEAAEKCRPNEAFEVIRHDQLQDLARNVQWSFEEALEDKDETTWLWWINKQNAEKKSKGEKK
jgi:hypothetical protein